MLFNDQQLKLVIVGHVDHGKSTVLGRLLADINALPEGKLESVKENCRKNSKPFEYAFLLDALKDEQAQGITIDSARCFFNSEKRHYLVFDAPGHIEFLKNMVTGAARAEAALLVIDSNEGIQENSRRHGYLLSMLGIKQVAVVVNKMDLVNYSEERYQAIKTEYSGFLNGLGVKPFSFIPVSAREGVNIAEHGNETSWYSGPTVLEQMDAFENAVEKKNEVFRFPVQDIYKFTESEDDRRITVGNIESGSVSVGDKVIFYPARKKAEIASIEIFNSDEKKKSTAGEAVGFTLHPQIYIEPGEMMVKADQQAPHFGQRFKANLFWMGKAPFIQGKLYKLKFGSKAVGVRLAEIHNVIDASELSTLANKKQIDRHDVGEVILEASKPIAFDTLDFSESTSRFVIVDNYEIAGGGVVLEPVDDSATIFEAEIARREKLWKYGDVKADEKAMIYGHKPKFIVITGRNEEDQHKLGKNLEKLLFRKGFKTYYLGMSNLSIGLGSDVRFLGQEKEEEVRRLGELARILTDSGQIFITSLSDLDDFDISRLKKLNKPYEILVITLGETLFSQTVAELPLKDSGDLNQNLSRIVNLLRKMQIFGPEYVI